ncbi:MAG: helix-turn-helix domain-containing protein [Terriglobales bacterium]|jgi:excisionase family DNA binding protein
MIEPFVDASDVAQFLAITRRQVLELARAGKIPAHPLLGSRRKVWRFKLSEVDAAIAGGSGKPAESTIVPAAPKSQRSKSNG